MSRAMHGVLGHISGIYKARFCVKCFDRFTTECVTEAGDCDNMRDKCLKS